MPRLRFKERIVRLGALHDNLLPLLAELPHLTRDHTALAAVLIELRQLESEKSSATSNMRRITHRRRELGSAGGELRSRLAAGLRSHYGDKNEELNRFGVPPRPREIRRRALSKAERAAQLVRQAAELAAEAATEEAVRAALDAALDAARNRRTPARPMAQTGP